MQGEIQTPDAALWRRDWTLRPAGAAFVELTRKQWWTDAQGVTGADGRYTTRAFLGDYEITAESGNRTRAIAEKALGIAADICIYTNRNLTIETLGG